MKTWKLHAAYSFYNFHNIFSRSVKPREFLNGLHLTNAPGWVTAVTASSSPAILASSPIPTPFQARVPPVSASGMIERSNITNELAHNAGRPAGDRSAEIPAAACPRVSALLPLFGSNSTRRRHPRNPIRGERKTIMFCRKDPRLLLIWFVLMWETTGWHYHTLQDISAA